MKLGVIGCGRIALLAHLKILSRLPGVDSIAIADTDVENLRLAKDLTPDAELFTDYHQLLSIPDLRAVVICLPNALHAEAAIAALKAEKCIYLEKPFATSLRDAEAIINAWRAGDEPVAMIGFQYRFHPSYIALKQLIESGKFHRPVLVQTTFTTAGKDLPDWKQSRSTGGGVLPDFASHHIDLFRFLFHQEVTEVFAKTWTRRSEEDCALLLLSFTNGLRTQSFFSFASIEENRFEIYDESGKLCWESLIADQWEILDPKLSSVRVKRLWSIARSFAKNPYLFTKNSEEAFLRPYRGALMQFIDAVRTGQKCKPDFLDALENARVIQAAQESAASGKTIALK